MARIFLTKEQHAEVLSLHQSGKRARCEALCVAYGVRPDYARNMASKLKLPCKYRHYPVNRDRPDDSRWAWAIQRGAVSA